MKKLCALMILGMIGFSVSAQSVRDKIDKAHKDPATKERAAKADSKLINKKNIADKTKPRKDPGLDRVPNLNEYLCNKEELQ